MMETRPVFLCLMIGWASSATVPRFEFPVFFRNASGEFSNVHGDSFKYNESYVESTFQWITHLPKNVTVKQFLEIGDKYFQAFEKHVDKLRNVKRIDQQHYSTSSAIEKSNENYPNILPVKDDMQVILAEYITIDSSSDTIKYSVVMSKKIYDELEKEHVLDTSWFKKRLGERKNLIETAAKQNPGFYDGLVEFI